jgi:heat shock protein HslJ
MGSERMRQNCKLALVLVFVALSLAAAFFAPLGLAVTSSDAQGNKTLSTQPPGLRVLGGGAEKGSVSGSAAFADAPLFGTKWRLTQVGNVAVTTTKTFIQLDAQTKRFSGDGGCNRMSGVAEVTGRTVKFSRIISTKRACADAKLQQVENELIGGLERANSFFIRGNVMRLYAAGLAVLTFKTDSAPIPGKTARRILRPNSLCGTDEQIIFSCRLKRPARIVSLCASPDLQRDQGYLQYRFGLPRRIELEYPEERQGTQKWFEYTHYFRFEVDLTEINFSIEGNRYQIFHAYNGEEKPRVIQYGVTITPPTRESVSYHCRTKPKADYSKLDVVLREN